MIFHVSYMLPRSLWACVHINAAVLGFGTSTQGRKQYSVKSSVTLGLDNFPDTTESPESEASKRARHRMNWQDESDDDLNDYFDEVWVNVACFLNSHSVD